MGKQVDGCKPRQNRTGYRGLTAMQWMEGMPGSSAPFSNIFGITRFEGGTQLDFRRFDAKDRQHRRCQNSSRVRGSTIALPGFAKFANCRGHLRSFGKSTRRRRAFQLQVRMQPSGRIVGSALQLNKPLEPYSIFITFYVPLITAVAGCSAYDGLHNGR